jgi:hypothetical protein
MNNELLYQSFVEHLKTVEGLFPLNTENNLIRTAATQPFAKATMIWADEPTHISIGLTGHDRHLGIFRVDLYVPVNTGTTVVNELADKIIEAFPRGTVFKIGDHDYAHAIKAYRTTANRLNEQFHTVPVSVRWSLIYTSV